jgi:hypothetical protein
MSTLQPLQLGIEGIHQQIRVCFLDGHRRSNLQHIRGGPVDPDQDSGLAHSVRDPAGEVRSERLQDAA